ncbi:MAG: hypothetical protein U1E65_03465 [Myxococcota bacterium]
MGESQLALEVLNEGDLVADGTTAVQVRVCNVSGVPRDKVTVTLLSNLGHWEESTSDAKRDVETILTASSTCATERWIPPTSPGLVRFEARVDGALERREERMLRPATIGGIHIHAEPAALGQGTVHLSIDFQVAGGGKPSDGTRLQIQLVEAAPAGTALLGDGPIIVGAQDSIDLTTAEEAKAVRIEAEYPGLPRTCRVLLKLGQTSTTTRVHCP